MEYVCQKGDTLKEVAEKFKIEVEKIKELNPNVTRLKQGLVLQLPSKLEENEEISKETNEEKNIYIVKTKKGGPLNVRKESGGEILKTIDNGTEIEVLEIADGWCKLENGYVLEELVIKKETN